MAKSPSNRPASVADVQRLLAKATVSGGAKSKKQSRRDKSGPSNPPIAIGSTLTLRGPSNVAAGAGNTRIRNTEFVTDVTTGSAVPTLGFDLNPTSSTLFTWLGRIAGGFELFKFHKLTFTYTPICTTSTPGVVIMAFDYDASDAAPANKQIMSAYAGSSRTNVWNKLTCDLRPPAGWFYTGNSGPGQINPTNTDIKFYDVAKFYLSVFNSNPSVTVGELTVTYDVEFSKPDFGPSMASEALTSFNASNLSNLPGTSFAIAGPNIVTLTSPASRQLAMDFNIPGSYLIEICNTCQASNSTANTFDNPMITDPGSTAASAQWAEFVTTGWTSPSGTITGLNLLVVNAKVLTRVVLAASSLVTSMTIFRMRIANYQQQ